MDDIKQWDPEKDLPALLSFIESIDCDDIKVKEAIKKRLINNRFIIHAIHNEELEKLGAEPDEYIGLNILPYYIFPDTQHNRQIYICFEVAYNESNQMWPRNGTGAMKRTYPYVNKLLHITFYIQCDNKDSSWIIDQETGVSRHDLLAALIQDEFNYTNIGGGKIVLVSDEPSTTDNFYSTRTLVFEQITDNNLVNSGYLKDDKNNGARLSNKDLVGKISG